MTTTQTKDDRVRARLIGQSDLGAWCVGVGWQMWSIQRHILQRLSVPRAVVTAPSCNSSGKTHLASRSVWAFLDSFRPGTPCRWCDGPCGGAKVITTSSTFDHLKLVLWTEIRVSRRQLVGTFYDDLPECYEGALRTQETDDYAEWFAIGLNPDTAEGIQGMHAPHKLIVAEEATALTTNTADGIGSLLASGDARMLCIYNPTTEDVWVERVGADPAVERIRIRAWDTPHFTGEPVPPGATLITPEWLQDLRARGMGPGTEVWERRVEAKPWGMGERTLIPHAWYDRARESRLKPAGPRVLSADLARFGDAENCIGRRWGPVLQSVKAWPAMDQRLFWRGPVLEECREFRPHMLIYDADGLGAGVGESVAKLEETLRREGITTEVLPFRGGGDGGEKFINVRSMKWWQYRLLYEQNHIRIDFDDDLLRAQTTSILYGFTEDRGKIRVESKQRRKQRAKTEKGNMPTNLDRADVGMYAFAYDLPTVDVPVIDEVPDRSDDAHWKKMTRRLEQREIERDEFGRRYPEVYDPVDGTFDDW